VLYTFLDSAFAVGDPRGIGGQSMTASEELIKAVFDAMAMVYERHPEYTGLYLSVDRLVQAYRVEVSKHSLDTQCCLQRDTPRVHHERLLGGELTR
jgi:hypothetical protein